MNEAIGRPVSPNLINYRGVNYKLLSYNKRTYVGMRKETAKRTAGGFSQQT